MEVVVGPVVIVLVQAMLLLLVQITLLLLVVVEQVQPIDQTKEQQEPILFSTQSLPLVEVEVVV